MDKPKYCSECQKLLVRKNFECNSNWKKRRTCGCACRFKRHNRMRMEKRHKAKGLFQGLDIDKIHKEIA